MHRRIVGFAEASDLTAGVHRSGCVECAAEASEVDHPVLLGPGERMALDVGAEARSSILGASRRGNDWE